MTVFVPFHCLETILVFYEIISRFHYAENAGHIGWVENTEVYIKAFHQLIGSVDQFKEND